MSAQLRSAILPFEGSISYSMFPPLAQPVFRNNFGTEVMVVAFNNLKDKDLMVAVDGIAFLRGTSSIQQAVVQVGGDSVEPWLRWPELGQQLSIEELRAADKAYRASLICDAQQWQALVKKLKHDPQWGWYFVND